MPLSTIHHLGGKRSSPLAKAAVVTAATRKSKFGVNAGDKSKAPCELNEPPPRDPQLGSPGAAVAFPVGASSGDGGGKGSLWGAAGAPPTGESLIRSSARNYRIGSLGNWPLNTTERWMRAVVTQDNSQERLEKLREIRLNLLAERERKKAAWAPVDDSSSDSGSSEDSEEPETGVDEETERQRQKRRKLKKALRKKARRQKKRDAEMKSFSNRARWHTAGRHGGIVARAQASVPALATRGDLVQLKEHADRVLIGKLVRCWGTLADFFGVEHTDGTHEVPPSPCGDDRKLSGDAAEFWKLLSGSKVKLTPEETGVVRRRLEENAAKKKEQEEEAERRGDGDSTASNSVLTVESGEWGDDHNAKNLDAEKTRITYAQIHGALFRSEDLEALAAAFMREGELREKEERRMALKRQQFEDSMAERRSGAIAEVVNAYAAGLGYRPSTKGKRRRVVDNGGKGGGEDDDTHGDTASETTAGTATTTSGSAGALSSLSSRSNPAKDWWTDGGVSNCWAMSPPVRKTLFLCLQAGAVAHMSLKQRRAIEVPWVKGVTHITLRRPKDALVACAKYGRDFYRLTAAQVVLALRAYAAERIQAQWRGWIPRRRFAPKIVALRKLVEREHAIRAARRRAAFGGWKEAHRARMELIRGTRRPFHVWRMESERLARISALFRGTYWPLYVWRRWANYRVSSRDKAKFLRKVYLTTVILRHFRAWNNITESGQRVTVRADRASSARLKAKADRLFRWWAGRMRQKKCLHRQWINGGMWLRLKINTRQVSSAFIILRYWAFARTACARRSDAHFRSYYLLGEMDRRRGLAEKRGWRQQLGRPDKGAYKSNWHTPGGHLSRRITREVNSASRSAAGGNGNDGHDHNTAGTIVDDINRETFNGAAAGIEHDRSPKGHQSESPVGSFPKFEEDRIAEPLNGGGHRSTRRGQHTTTVFNPPIAVLGRPNHVNFPGLEDTHFGEGVQEGGAKVACEVLRGHFEKKEVLKARVNFLLYQRLAPQVLVRLRIKADERQRYRYAAYMDARRTQKKHLVAWHFATIQISVLKRGITVEAMSLAIDSVRSETDEEGSHSLEMGSQNNSSSVVVATMAAHPLGPLPGGQGTGAATSADQALVGNSTGVEVFGSGGGGGRGGIALDDGALLESVDQLQEERVNQLQEDRKMRRRQVERTAARLSRLFERTAMLKKQSTQDEENTTAWLNARQARERAVAKFLTREGAKARAADEKAKEFIAGFSHHAADNLVGVVTRIFCDVVYSRRSIILRKTMRQWHSWYMLRVSVQLFNRARLRNWLRICARLRYLWRGMPLFRELRVKWFVFHRLLELTDQRMRYGTPDLPAVLRRRRELLLDYSCLLKERALVQRWKQYTQGRAVARFLGDSLRRRYLHRVARSAFDVWRTGVGPRQRREAAAMKAAVMKAATAAARSEASAAPTRVRLGRPLRRNTEKDEGVNLEEEDRGEKAGYEEEGKDEYGTGGGDAGVAGEVEADCRRGRHHKHEAEEGSKPRRRQQRASFIEERVLADLTVARRTVIAGWKGALTRAIGLRQAKQEHRLKKQGRLHPTFKKFMAFHTWQATERVRTEARLLVDAFLNRGRIKFRDQEPPDVVGRSHEKGSSSGSGLIPFSDRSVPGSHLVCEVRVMTRVGEGVVGLQLVMTGGKRTVELPVHGAAVGENRSTRAHSFAVDAPVERLSRFECEHSDGLIERLRVVTSGGRWSPWFGDKLTVIPRLASLPDWKHHSLAATTSAAALEAKKAAAAAALASLEEVSSAEKTAAAVAAAEAEAVAARAPEWNIQKEYITGLAGIRTHERLVGLGVITRHVTNSHVFSYLWEAAEEDERVTDNLNSDGDGSVSDKTPSHTSIAPGGWAAADESTGNRGDSSISVATPSRQPSPSTATPSGGSSISGGGGGGASGGGSGASGQNPNASAASSGGSTTLSRAEAKQLKFAQEMRDREQLSKERERLAREKEQEMERLLRGKKRGEDSEDDDDVDDESLSSVAPVAAGIGKRTRAPPAPQKEFSHMLRMRGTDARCALERSVALAHAARTYAGNSANGFDDAGGALGTLTVVVGLTKWLHSALLPQLVPLPVPATTTTAMFNRGEKMCIAARATEARGRQAKIAAEKMSEARRKRGRRGVMSPTQRAQEVRDRENLVELEGKSAMLMEKARRQRDEGERLLDDAKDRLPKVSQSVKTLRMYLEYLKLARRQIDLEREFGLGALRTNKSAEGGQGGEGGKNAVQPLPSACGLEESIFDATIKSLLHERQDNNLGREGGVRGVDDRSQGIPFPNITEEGPSIGPENSMLETVSSVNPWF
eukprot:g12696.t1